MRPTERLYALTRTDSHLDRIARPFLWRLRNAKMSLRSWRRRARLALFSRMPQQPLRLHVGSGSEHLEGWVNVDLEALPGVTHVADVTHGLPFSDVESLYAEHFLEHLAVDDALGFLLEAHRVLVPGGHLRLSTPNLDWVAETHALAPVEPDTQRRAMRFNRAFFGWGHRFLWSRALLAEALTSCGFDRLHWPAYGASDFPEMQQLERHERYGDTAAHRHVLIAECERGVPRPRRLRTLLSTLGAEFLHHTERRYSESYWRQDWWETGWRAKRRSEGVADSVPRGSTMPMT